MELANSELKNDNLLEKTRKLEKMLRMKEENIKTLEGSKADAKQDLNQVISAVQEIG